MEGLSVIILQGKVDGDAVYCVYGAALLLTHQYTDGFIEALCCGCAPQDGLGYRDQHI